MQRAMRWAPAAAVVAAAAFMFWGAAHYTFFDDEAFSFQRYILPPGELVAALRDGVEPDPPLYYLCVGAWIRVWGITPPAVRSLSILVYLLGLAALYAAGRAWFDAAAARWAVLLCALHPLHLFFGFAARWYGMMFLWTALLLWTTAGACGWTRRSVSGDPAGIDAPRNERVRPGWFVAWVAAATAAFYTNYFAACVVGLLWLYGVYGARFSRRRMTAWIVSAAAVLLLYVPWGSALLAELQRFPRMERSLTPYLASFARTGA
ncbi:MAG: hypothetical protein V3T70_02800, partial [Phycisphaerae bacterium]